MKCETRRRQSLQRVCDNIDCKPARMWPCQARGGNAFRVYCVHYRAPVFFLSLLTSSATKSQPYLFPPRLKRVARLQATREEGASTASRLMSCAMDAEGEDDPDRAGSRSGLSSFSRHMTVTREYLSPYTCCGMFCGCLADRHAKKVPEVVPGKSK